jgi:glycosyltransferase involved in cell wall biosynthesis
VFKPEPDDACATRGEIGIPDGRILLLYVGRLAAEKNTRILFEAFELLNRRQPGRFHLLAIGDGSQRGHLQDLQAATGAVTWFPYCADVIQLARYYRAADLFVHPGVQETFGLVALESQASSASRAATWTASFSIPSRIGPGKTPPRRWRMPSRRPRMPISPGPAMPRAIKCGRFIRGQLFLTVCLQFTATS